VFVDDTGVETSGTRAGADNGTDGARGIDSDVVTGLCGKKYGMDSKNMTFADTKYFLVIGL